MGSFVFETAWGWCAARVTVSGVAALELPVGSRERALRAAARLRDQEGADPRAWRIPYGKWRRQPKPRKPVPAFGLSASPSIVERRRGPVAAEMVRQVRSYFDGGLKRFDLPFDWSGATDFQQSVWRRLLALPFGTTATYGELARRLGSPSGARAVGGAVGANPTPLLAPCHRVVGSHGELGGFSAEGGVAVKKRLLRFEAGLG